MEWCPSCKVMMPCVSTTSDEKFMTKVFRCYYCGLQFTGTIEKLDGETDGTL